MRSLIMTIAALIVVLNGAAFAGWTEPVPISELNTSYQESGPWLLDDGLTIYFNRYTDHWRLYKATRASIDDPFSSPVQISELNGSFDSSYAWVSPDGLRMYYTQNRKLRTASRVTTSSPWVPGSYLSDLNTFGNNNVEDARLSADECTIIFSSVAANGKWDLNIASRPDTSVPFGNIRVLSELNTLAHDNGSSVMPDGLTVYFTSDRSGGWIFYKATRLNVNDPFGVPEVSFFPSGRVCMDGQTILVSSNWNIYVSYWTVPVADAGDDQVVYSSLDGMAEVTLDGSDSNDPQGDELTYTWSYIIDGNEITVDGANPQIVLPAGIHTITLVVNDGKDDSEADDVIVEVVGPLKVDMKFMPVFPWPPSRMLIAQFDFPAHLNEQLDPYLIALAADPNVTVDYFDFSVYGDSIRRCNVGFNMNEVPESLLQPKANIVIFGSFKSGQLFYGEDTLKKIHPLLRR